MKKILSLLTVCVLTLSLLTACSERKPFSVALAAYPENTEYAVGEAFRYDGLVLIVTYSDGSLEEIPVTADMITFSAESAGGAVARIAYTYNGFTAATYVNTVVRDTLSEYKGAAIAIMAESRYYKENADDLGIRSLYDGAVTEILSAATASEVDAVRDRFLSDLALLFSDKSEAEAAVALVDLSGLPDSLRIIAESDRDRALLAIALAETPEIAMAHANLFIETVERYYAEADNLASGEKKAEIYVNLRDRYQQEILANSVMYDNDTLLHLASIFDAAGLRILMAGTVAEAESIAAEAIKEAAATRTRIDLVYDALLLVYAGGAVTYTDECLKAIEAAEAALATAEALPPAQAAVLLGYGVAFENRIDAFTYIDGKIDLVSAVSETRARYAVLAAAALDTEGVRVAVDAIGNVDLAAEERILAAEAAYDAWVADNAIDEENRGNVILGAYYDILQKARADYDALALLAKERAATVILSIEAIGKVTLDSEAAIAGAEIDYNDYLLAYAGYESYAEAFIENLQLLREAKTRYDELCVSAVTDGETLKAYKPILSAGGYLTGTAGDEKITEAENAYKAFVDTYGASYVEVYVGSDLLPVIEAARAAYEVFFGAATLDAEILVAYGDILSKGDYLTGKAGDALIADAENAYAAFLQTYGQDYFDKMVGASVLSVITAARNAYETLTAAAKTDGDALKAYRDLLSQGDYLTGTAGDEKITEAENAYAAFLQTYGAAYAAIYVDRNVLPAIEAARLAYRQNLFTEEKDAALLSLRNNYGVLQSGADIAHLSRLVEVFTEWNEVLNAVTYDEWSLDPNTFSMILTAADAAMREAIAG